MARPRCTEVTGVNSVHLSHFVQLFEKKKKGFGEFCSISNVYGSDSAHLDTTCRCHVMYIATGEWQVHKSSAAEGSIDLQGGK